MKDSPARLLIWLDYLQSLNSPLPSDSPGAGTGSCHGFLLLISPSLVTYKTGRVIGQASEDNSITLSYFSWERCSLFHSVCSFWSSLGLLVVHMYIRAHGELTELGGIIKTQALRVSDKKHPRWWHFCLSRALGKRSVLNCIECVLVVYLQSYI